MNVNTIEDVRKCIDEIDRELVKLIAHRSEYVKAVARFKIDHSAVRAPERVQQVIEKVCKQAIEEGLSVVIIEKVYRAMISAFIDYELDIHKNIQCGNEGNI